MQIYSEQYAKFRHPEIVVLIKTLQTYIMLFEINQE